jgi:hypothetical protein
LASHNRCGFHHRYNHHYRNHNLKLNNNNNNNSLLPSYSTDEDNAQQHRQRQRYQRRGISLSAMANNSAHNNTTDANDPGDVTTTNGTSNIATTRRDTGAATDRGNDEAASEKRSKSPRVPKLRLFYNDVYEVKLPPKHRFPMGKYRKVREKVQNKIAKLPQETRDSVDCGEWNISVS